MLHVEARIREKQVELAVFDASPDAYARRHYPNHTADSYPVRTRILNIRISLEHYLIERIEGYEAIRASMSALLLYEEWVAAKVAAMRPTPGRVEWPFPLPPLGEALEDGLRTWPRLLPDVIAGHRARLDVMKAEQVRSYEEMRAGQRAEVNIEFDPWAGRRVPPDVRPLAISKQLDVLGVGWPISLAELRVRWLVLVRRYHPDATGGDARMESVLKSVNVAYEDICKHLQAQRP